MDISDENELVKYEFCGDKKPYTKGNICRLCLCGPAELYIFSDNIILSKIKSCCALEMFQNDGLPEHICGQCCDDINVCVNFKNKCLESDKILRKNMSVDVVKLEVNVEYVADIKLEVKDEYLSNREMDDSVIDDDDVESDDDKQPLEILKSQKLLPRRKIIKNFEIEDNDYDDVDSEDDKKPLEMLKLQKHRLKRKITNSKNNKTSKNGVKKKSVKKKIVKQESSDDHENLVKRKKTDASASKLCPYCGKLFPMPRLSRHMRIHLERQSHSCPTCLKVFCESWQLKRHLRVHSDSKNYSCEVCGKLFRTHRDVRRHTDAVHKKTLVVKCSICSKELSTPTSLKFHLKTHTGEKEFQCSTCNRKFISKPCLMLHMRTHTGEKPYSCKFCDKKFSIGKTLKEHERIHTGETPYKCPVCSKGFSQKSNMKSHFRYNHKGIEFKSCLNPNSI